MRVGSVRGAAEGTKFQVTETAIGVPAAGFLAHPQEALRETVRYRRSG